MATITINNANIRHNRTVLDERSGTRFNRLHITGDLTKALAKQLDCGKLFASDDEWQSAKLSNSLRLARVTVTPTKELAQHSIQFEASEAKTFKVKRGDDGKVSLSFVVSTAAAIAGVVEEYLGTVGYVPAKCILLTSRAPQQQKLGEAEEGEEEGAEQEAEEGE